MGSFAHLNVCRHLVKCPWAKLPKNNTPTLSLFKQRIIPAKRRLPSLFKSQECKTEARRDALEGLGQIPPQQGVSESLSWLPFSLQSLDLRYREREIRELVGFFKYFPNAATGTGKGASLSTHTQHVACGILGPPTRARTVIPCTELPRKSWEVCRISHEILVNVQCLAFLVDRLKRKRTYHSKLQGLSQTCKDQLTDSLMGTSDNSFTYPTNISRLST